MGTVAKLIISILTLYVIIQILKINGVFEKTSGVKSLSREIDNSKKRNKKIQQERKALNFYSSLCEKFGQIVLSDDLKSDYKFKIDRLELSTKYLDRFYTPEELRGKELFILLVGLAFIPLGVVLPVVFLITVGCGVNFFTANSIRGLKVDDEDRIIEEHFIELFLMLYPKLKSGSKARLAPVVSNYIKTLDSTDKSDVSRVMKKFATFFENNLFMYEETTAVPKLKERYRSSLITNFCNVATQSLQGIENYDTLLSTRMELIRKKKEKFVAISEKNGEKQRRAIYVIYINLVIFIILTLMSVAPKSLF